MALALVGSGQMVETIRKVVLPAGVLQLARAQHGILEIELGRSHIALRQVELA